VRRAACLAARDRSVSFVRPISDSSDSLTRVSADRKETRRRPRGNEGKSRTVQGRDRSVSLRDIRIDPRLFQDPRERNLREKEKEIVAV